MATKYRFFHVLMALCTLLFSVACERPESKAPSGDAPAADGPIRVGVYASLTGSEATYGSSSKNGFEVALEAFNAAGGVNGRKVEGIIYDTKSQNAETGLVVTRLIDSDKVVALLGEVASGRSIAGGRIAQQKGVPMITHASTKPEVTEIGPMVHRICFTDDFQGYGCATFARNNLKKSTAAVLYDAANPYSIGLRKTFLENFTAMGGTIVADQAYNAGDPDFSAQLTTIREKKPEILFLPGFYTEVGNIALQARKLGIDATFLGGDGWVSPQLAVIGGEAIEGAYYFDHCSPSDPSPAMRAFVESYKAKIGEEPDSMAALAYDAAKILFDAMKRAPSLSGADLAAAIAATKDFEGATGRITLDANRNANKSGVIVQMQGGRPVYSATIEPPAAAAAP
jgi:branched-chain amino acid transport system substrate-binding protein